MGMSLAAARWLDSQRIAVYGSKRVILYQTSCCFSVQPAYKPLEIESRRRPDNDTPACRSKTKTLSVDTGQRRERGRSLQKVARPSNRELTMTSTSVVVTPRRSIRIASQGSPSCTPSRVHRYPKSSVSASKVKKASSISRRHAIRSAATKYNVHPSAGPRFAAISVHSAGDVASFDEQVFPSTS